jgi:hypothetical protein
MKRPLLIVASLLVASALPATETVPLEWQTVAEKSAFRATSSYDETVDLLRRIADSSPAIQLEFFGHSAMGRPLPLVVVSAKQRFTPEAAARAGAPVLLIQSCIHAGEVDGKDASLVMLRDWALERRALPSEAVVLFVPIFNADGHERVSPFNRPNQEGPVEGMGFRTTANGINLNRDHVRLASPEMRALIRLFNRWRPHLHVDNHVTDGSDHAWILTWIVSEPPLLHPAIHGWNQTHLTNVLKRTAEAGHPNGPYVSLADRVDPTRGIEWYPSQPRLSSEHFPLRNRASVTIEVHSYKPFRDRVMANHDFLVELVSEMDRGGEDLIRAVGRAEADTVARGRVGAEASEVVVRWRLADTVDGLLWPAYDWVVEESLVTGGSYLRYLPGRIRELEVSWRHAPAPELTLPRPRGYLVLAGWPQIERMVHGHGLRAHRVKADIEADVETIRVSEPELATAPYQGAAMVENFAVSRQAERRVVPAGSLWIPADQPDFEVAVQLFEPEAPDSMLRWGLISTVFERKEYIGTATLEEQARQMLQDDELRAEWQRALEDESFAGDPRARALWWYRRTPFWDEQVGLLPIMRVLEVPSWQTEPWQGPPGGVTPAGIDEGTCP